MGVSGAGFRGGAKVNVGVLGGDLSLPKILLWGLISLAAMGPEVYLLYLLWALESTSIIYFGLLKNLNPVGSDY